MSKVVALRPRKPVASAFARPMPPAFDPLGEGFAPAHGVGEWVQKTLLDADGPLHNPDHSHLDGADIAFLWAASGYDKGMRHVVGTAEEVTFRASGWPRWRAEDVFKRWFGRVPAYLITLSASYSVECSDAEWCALVEHELYHIAQALDEFGAPKFARNGLPVLRLRGHDVEEFVGVVRRYGVGREGGSVDQLVKAAKQKPLIDAVKAATVCGTCLVAA